ncbi:NgoBV family restriction endonuclease [Alloprevotella tannerae]|jgi:type-2 restriction enzyme nlaIV|uniref:NgoBV family restriction endonuclease n=1 Tax=Alloprevotella tannerae TaxID=76122 RepID=UPI0028E36D35|nr:NgoBV family restriction endonuclease [Alloprevotella tannerae]
MNTTKRFLTPEEVFDTLLNVDKITSLEGQIRFYLGDVDIVVRQRDVVGNIIQEWLEGWLKHNNIYYKPNVNSQMPPDIYLSEDKTKNLLEVKAFNADASPAFDIADFKAYAREIIEKPYMLHTKYLIFAYKMSEEGIVTIKNIWLKNVWEICRAMDKQKNWAVNVQYKNGQIHKIRPAAWYSKIKTKYPTFRCLEDFISALEETILLYGETRQLGNSGWKNKVVQAYKNHFGKKLVVPRWMDIEDKYRLAEAVKPE